MEETWDRRELQTVQEVGQKGGASKLKTGPWHKAESSLEKFLTTVPPCYPATTLQPGKSLSQIQMHGSSMADVVPCEYWVGVLS